MTDDRPFSGARARTPEAAIHSCEDDSFPSEPSSSGDTFGLVGRTPLMRQLRADIVRYAPKSAPVVIRGETGTGKELVARALHTMSTRARMPFVATNAATFHPQLLAAELFGHERGAFTGAIGRHRGLFDQADNGTLFLDELGELDAVAQAQLLRVLESGELRPLGTERTHTVDVRLIVATHRDLAAMVRAGAFREDLFYRLNALTISVPPLRRRAEDIPFLVTHILTRLRPEVGEKVLDPEAIVPLTSYGWPGNVRQLLNVIRRAAIHTDRRTIDAAAICQAFQSEPDVHNAFQSEPKAKSQIVTRAPHAAKTDAATIESLLRAEHGRISPVARQLGIARSSLRDLIKRHQIVVEREP